MLHPIKYFALLTFALLLFLNLAITALAAPPPQPKLLPYMTEDELYGYIDISGRVVIEPQFDFAGEFVEGLALVSQEDKLGYIDETGAWVIEPQFRAALPFAEGLALVNTSEGLSFKGAYSYIDRTGKVVIPRIEFDYGSSFREGLAVVTLFGQTGFIDKTGQVVIQPQYASTQDFSEGLAAVVVEQKGSYIDKTGKLIEQKWGYIDKTGNMVIPPQFDYGTSFSEGLAQITLKKKTGFIDKTGKMVITPQFEAAGDFHEGLAFVHVGDKVGYMNKTGKMVIAPQFETGVSFANGLALIRIEGKYGYIDKTGQIVIKPQFVRANSFHDGLALVWFDEVSQGYIDTKGNILFYMPLPLYSQPRTHQVPFIPLIPAEKRPGSCVGPSRMVNQPFAWRCTTNDNVLHDPCLLAGDGETLVCDTNPAQFELGFALILTDSLPLLPSPSITPSQPITHTLTRQMLENGTYFFPEAHQELLIDPRRQSLTATLKNGYFKQVDDLDDIQVALIEPMAYGDLNGDGLEDAVVIFVTITMGPSQYTGLAAVINDNGQPKNVAVASLGDRTFIDNIRIDNGQIIIDVITRGAYDAACCPTQSATYKYWLDNNQLTLQNNSQWLIELDNHVACHVIPNSPISLADGQGVGYRCNDESYLTDIITKGQVWKTDKVVITQTHQPTFTVVSSQTMNIYITWQPTDPLQVAQEIGLMPHAVTMTLGKVAQRMVGQVRPATTYGPDVPPALQDRPVMAAPAHLIFTFDDRVLPIEEEVDFTQAQLLIYPLEAYQKMYTQTGNKVLEQRVSQLKTLLATRPTSISDTLPVLPDLYRPQALTAQIKYLDFKHGSGIRFITYYDDYPGHSVPATNETIFYTFQGLTQDGKYYLAYFSPITTAVLPNHDKESEAAKDMEAFIANWDNYLIKTQQALNNTTDFTPTLTSLDTMLQSLRFEPQ